MALPLPARELQLLARSEPDASSGGSSAAWGSQDRGTSQAAELTQPGARPHRPHRTGNTSASVPLPRDCSPPVPSQAPLVWLKRLSQHFICQYWPVCREAQSQI